MREDAHARQTGDAPEPLYNLDIPIPTHAERARTLVGRSRPEPCALWPSSRKATLTVRS